MVTKRIRVDWEKCTGCKRCMLICSAFKEGLFQPGRARIHVVSFPREGVSFPLICYQCENAPCLEVCPVEALKRGRDGIILLNANLCTGCRVCEESCPFGMIEILDDKAVKCDLCGGTPKCVEVCEPKALQVTDIVPTTSEFWEIKGKEESAQRKREERWKKIFLKLQGVL